MLIFRRKDSKIQLVSIRMQSYRALIKYYIVKLKSVIYIYEKY